MMPFPAILPTGALLPEWTLDSEFFGILATFVALNSLMYATLALLKVLPRGYAFSRFNGRNRRVVNRSIYPDPPAPAAFDDPLDPEPERDLSRSARPTVTAMSSSLPSGSATVHQSGA